MNAKQEFLSHVKYVTEENRVECVLVTYKPKNSIKVTKMCTLPINYTKDQFEEFLELLDFDYEHDDDCHVQGLDGTIWFANDTWSDRVESCRFEWWLYHEHPEIPSILKN